MHLHVHHGMHVEGNERMWLHVRLHESFIMFNQFGACGFKAGATVQAVAMAAHTELCFV